MSDDSVGGRKITPGGALEPESARNAAVYEDVRAIIEDGRRRAAVAVNSSLVQTNWSVGRRIYEEIGERTPRNSHLLSYLSKRLTAEYGRGYTERNLRYMRRFYLAFPYRHAVRADISWSHYRLLVSCDTQEERDWYLNATAENGWGERELKRQIQTRAYWRLVATQKRDLATPPWANPATPSPTLADDILKGPYVFEFVPEPPRRESDLEQALIDSLQAFLMELGRGFMFYARQRRVTSGDSDYYIDLVLYNYELDCALHQPRRQGQPLRRRIPRPPAHRAGARGGARAQPPHVRAGGGGAAARGRYEGCRQLRARHRGFVADGGWMRGVDCRCMSNRKSASKTSEMRHLAQPSRVAMPGVLMLSSMGGYDRRRKPRKVTRAKYRDTPGFLLI